MRRISWLAEVPVNFSIRTLARCRKHEIPDTQGRFCPPPKSNKPSYVTVWEGSSVRFTAFSYLVLCCMSARLSPSEKRPVYVLRHFRIVFYAVCPPACSDSECIPKRWIVYNFHGILGMVNAPKTPLTFADKRVCVCVCTERVCKNSTVIGTPHCPLRLAV